jgi:hypothetical protein
VSLEAIHLTVSVLISAGVGTRLNTKWCEDYRIETIDATTREKVAIADICCDLGLHLTLIGTCGFCHSYQMHAYLERLLDESRTIESDEKAFSRSDSLRPTGFFPAGDVTTASFGGRLLRFPKINCIPTSMTVLLDLTPLPAEFSLQRHRFQQGRPQEIADPSIVISEVQISQETSKSMNNSTTFVVPARLIARFGETSVPTVNDGINKLTNLIKQGKPSQ